MKKKWDRPALIKIGKVRSTAHVLEACRDPRVPEGNVNNSQYPWKCRKYIGGGFAGAIAGSCDWCQS